MHSTDTPTVIAPGFAAIFATMMKKSRRKLIKLAAQTPVATLPLQPAEPPPAKGSSKPNAS